MRFFYFINTKEGKKKKFLSWDCPENYTLKRSNFELVFCFKLVVKSDWRLLSDQGIRRICIAIVEDEEGSRRMMNTITLAKAKQSRKNPMVVG